jgi:hypothetical protein
MARSAGSIKLARVGLVGLAAGLKKRGWGSLGWDVVCGAIWTGRLGWAAVLFFFLVSFIK